jgi:hypothetical protein
VAQRGFWRVHGGSVVAEGITDGAGLGEVTEVSSGGVGVDVVDVGRCQTGELNGASDGVACPLAVGVGLDDVEGVGRDSSPHEPGQDAGAARLGVLLGLDEHQRAALAQHHAVAVFVERSAGAGRVVVVGRQHAELCERSDRHGLDMGLDGATDRDVGLAENDVSPRLGDGRGTRGVSHQRRDDPGLGLAVQPDGGGRPIGHLHLHCQRGHRAQALLPPGVMLDGNLLGGTQREPDRHHEPPGVDLG